VSLAAVLVVAGGTGAWALNRFVIDHVEVADVAEYEAQLASAGEVTDTTLAALTESEVTDTSFTSDGVSIEISTKVVGEGDSQVTYYVADVQLDSATRLEGGFANNQFGTNIVQYTSEIAEANDAIFAINGDYYGFRDTGIVIRNGVLYRDEGARQGLAIYADGHMEIYDETQTTGQELIDAGVWNTLSFGPALVDGGQVLDGIDEVEVDTNFGNHSVQGNQPRTGLGMIDENHFIFVVADGRSPGYSNGVTMTEFAQIFVDAGATVAYNLDGGGSSTMYFNGELVNNPLGKNKERGTSDILYIGA
jgi:exopolysaccharide biosynthesis protein